MAGNKITGRGKRKVNDSENALPGKKTKIIVNKLPTPIKSEKDLRQYRAFMLNNQLKVLIISDLNNSENEAYSSSSDATSLIDSESDYDSTSTESYSDDDQSLNLSTKDDSKISNQLAALSICVGIGSFSDPEDIPGLAHLLGHMIFTGCGKYPEDAQDGFDAFILSYGGIYNAITEAEKTIFYFQIEQTAIIEAIDRIVNMLIYPHLKPETIEQELKFIDKEYQEMVQDDFYRKEQILTMLAKNNHPMSKFLSGNSTSMKINGLNLAEELVRFHQRYYSSHNMTVAMEGSFKLDEMEELISTYFSKIEERNDNTPMFTIQDNVFNDDSFGKIYKIVPVQKGNELNIVWSLPSLKTYYKNKPENVLSYLIGYEGKGSLISFLRKELLALNLYCGTLDNKLVHTSSYSLFRISIQLTNDGCDAIEKVLKAIFQYILMISNNLGEIGDRIFEEIKTMEGNCFLWQEPINSACYVEMLCRNMQDYEPQYYLTGNHLIEEFDGQILKLCLDKLTADKAILLLLSQHHEEEEICTHMEPWLHVPYCIDNLEENCIHNLQHVNENSVFYLPKINSFITSDFSIRKPDLLPLNHYPVKIVDTNRSTLWYKKDIKYNVPKAYVYFHLKTPILSKAITNIVCFDIFKHVLNYNLREVTYDASVTGMFYSFPAIDTGLVIHLKGFNAKICLLFEEIIDKIAHFDVDDKTFDVLKQQVGQTYYDNFMDPNHLANELKSAIILQTYCNSLDKYSIIHTITKDMVIAFVQHMKSFIYVEGLCQGNIMVEESIAMDNMLWDKLKCSKLPKIAHPDNRIMRLPPGVNYCSLRSLNESNPSSVILNYYQFGQGHLKDSCIMELLLGLMINASSFTNMLSFTDQKGHDVECSCKNYSGIIGFTINIQAEVSKSNFKKIDNYVENFLQEFLEELKFIKSKDFKQHVKILVKTKKCDDLHIEDEINRTWTEILTQTYTFDRLEREIECLKSVSLKDVKHTFQKIISGGDCFKKLSIHVLGYDENSQRDRSQGKNDNQDNEQNERNFELELLQASGKDIKKYIYDINEFKNQLPLYPVSKLL